jgi:hypothetical protein
MEYLRSPTPEAPEGFRVNASIHQKLADRKRRIERRLEKTNLKGCFEPMFTASNIH